MSAIAWEPIVYIARFPADAVAARQPYRLTATVQMFGDMAHAAGFVGSGLTPSLWRQFQDDLRARGARRLHFERPGGRLREVDLTASDGLC